MQKTADTEGQLYIIITFEGRGKCTDTENRLVIANEEGGGGGKAWEFGVSRDKLLHTGWINNKVLLCSTGNYIQYPVTSHMEKNMKNNIYMYN